MRRIFTVLTLLMLTIPHAQCEDNTILDNRLVEIIVTYQTYSESMPWQGNPPQTRYGYAVFLDSSRLLTTESLVRNHHLIEIRKPRTGRKIPAKVTMIDEQVNLAVLTIDETDENTQHPLIPICETLPLDANVQIVQFDETQQLQMSHAKVLQTKMSNLPDAPYNSLIFKLLADLNLNGNGVGVIYKNKLAGILMDYDRATRTGTMVPYLTIRQFLERCNQVPYPGFAHAGFKWAPLIDPAKRNFLHVTEPETGLLVLSCLTGTGAYESLKPKDVITEWDGYKIDNLGFYTDPDFGRMSISHLIKNTRIPNDTVPLTVIRDKETTHLNMKLCHLNDKDFLIPEDVAQEQAEYIIEGGLIIRELTGSYLRSFGSRWQTKLNSRIVNRYLNQEQESDLPGKHIVILVRVLPDPINIGYQPLNNMMITKVNGKTVNNLNDVFKIADDDGHITRITTDLLGIDIMLDEQSLDDANKRIANNYRIPYLRHQRPTL